MVLLEVRGVSKGFGPASQRAEVLHDINLEIESGEFVAMTHTLLLDIFAAGAASDIALFTRASKELKNTELKDFATKTLPHLQHHLEEAKRLQKK